MLRPGSTVSQALVLVTLLVFLPIILLSVPYVVPLASQKPFVPNNSIQPQSIVVVDESDEAAGESNDPDGGQARQTDWFWQQRAYPRTSVPGGYAQAALAHMQRMAMPQQAAAWQSIGPAPIAEAVIGFSATGTPLRTTSAGRVKQIVRVPNTSTVYIATSHSGLWRSDNLGQSWTSLTASLADFSFHALAIDPNNPNLLYAGTGEIAGYFGSGLLKTSDGGQTWTRLGQNEFGNLAISQIIVHPTNSNIVYAATSSAIAPNAPPYNSNRPTFATTPGIFRSRDGGMSWTRILSPTGQTRGFSDLVIDNSNPNQLYAAEYSVGVHKTTNEGQTWTTQILPNLSQRRAQRVELAIGSGATGANTLFAGVAGLKNNLAWGIVYATNDGGTTWRELVDAPNYCSDQCFFDNVILIDPRNPERVYLGGSLATGQVSYKGLWHSVIYRSTDGGTTWADMTPGTSVEQMVHPDIHALLADPDSPAVIWAGHDGGLARYDGTKWEARNGSLSSALVVGMAVSSDGSRAFIGTQDNAHIFFDGTTWLGVHSGDGGNSAFDATNNRLIYSTFYNTSGGSGVTLTRFEGTTIAELRRTWSNRRAVGINTTDTMLFYVPVEADPQQSGVAYVGTNRVYRTENYADRWEAISAALDAPVRSMAPLDTNTVYAGTTGGRIWRLQRPLGGSWTASDLTGANLPNRYLSDIEPVDSRTLYLAYNGFSANTPSTEGHIFKTSDGGASWVCIDGTGPGALPDLPALAIIRVGTTLYVGTDVGVFRSDNDGASWLPFNTGLAPVPVTQLRYNAATNTIWAGTYGRGVLRLTHLAPPATATATNSATSTTIATATPTPTNTATVTASATAIGSATATSSATATATATSSATATATATSSATATTTPPPSGPLPGSWGGGQVTFGITNDQRQLYGLQVFIKAPGFCPIVVSAPEPIAIDAQGNFSVTVQNRDAHWYLSGTISADGRSATGNATFVSVNTGSSVCGGIFSATLNWAASWQAAAPEPTAVPPTPVPPTMVPPTPAPTSQPGIAGQVYYLGQGLPGIVLNLRRCPVASSLGCDDTQVGTTVLTTTTAANGSYRFVGVPSLAANEVYRVTFRNHPQGGNAPSEGLLWRWLGPVVTTYHSGEQINGGSFSLDDILLRGPDTSAERGTSLLRLPATFSWQSRLPNDTYIWLLIDPQTNATLCASEPAQATSFVLSEQFVRSNCQQVTHGRTYDWLVRALSDASAGPTAGFGDSYATGSVTLRGTTVLLPIILHGKN